VANGRHARGKPSRHATTARHRRQKSSLPGAPGAPAVVAGAAAMAVATVGGLNVAEAQTATPQRHRPADVTVQAVHLDRQLGQVRQAAHEREVRASRERARRVLVERQRKEAVERKREQTQRRKRKLARLATMYVLPLEHFRLSAAFGATGGLWSAAHTGQDFSAPSGTPVRAVAQGVVTSAEWAGAYGWRIIVRHPDGTETWYCHLSSFVVRGGSVTPGQTIGRVGSTGNSTGPHLHFEVRENDQPISPLAWLRAHGVRI
jgi:murein DD-endopeptidase MepM/ murein hydrolase activator NlpD